MHHIPTQYTPNDTPFTKEMNELSSILFSHVPKEKMERTIDLLEYIAGYKYEPLNQIYLESTKKQLLSSKND